MILVDTSIWIDHLRRKDERLIALLGSYQVLVHPFVIGELALGSLRKRNEILSSLNDLPSASIATNEEVLAFITQNAIHGLGIGFIDAHLLASVRLTPGSTLWTRDKRLLAAAVRLGLTDELAH